MDKAKKIFVGIGTFFTGLISKVSALSANQETKYGVYDPGINNPSYRLLSIGKIALPIVFLFVGLIVLLRKKIANKAKTKIIIILILISIIIYILIDYIMYRY